MYDNFENIFDDLSSNSEKINGITNVNVNEIFNTSFFKKYTTINSLNEFVEKSPFENLDFINSENIDQNELDKYIKSISDFFTWNDFFNQAQIDYAINTILD